MEPINGDLLLSQHLLSVIRQISSLFIFQQHCSSDSVQHVSFLTTSIATRLRGEISNKKAVLSQGKRAMTQLFVSV